VEWRVAVIFISPHQVQHADQGNHGQNRHICTPSSIAGYFYFKSLPNILFPNKPYHIYNFSTSSQNLSIKPKPTDLRESYFLNLSTMSEPSTQTSPTKTSPQKPSPSKSTTSASNDAENPSVSLPKPSDVITDATPITMVHPSFASILNPTHSNPSPSTKSKPKKSTKSVATRKSKSQKPKSRYYSDFDMQKLYLDDLETTSKNVASDAATTTSSVEIKGTENFA
jgi:hypothetical protein